MTNCEMCLQEWKKLEPVCLPLINEGILFVCLDCENSLKISVNLEESKNSVWGRI